MDQDERKSPDPMAAFGVLAILFPIVEAVVLVVTTVLKGIAWFVSASEEQRRVAYAQFLILGTVLVLGTLLYNAFSDRSARKEAAERYSSCVAYCRGMPGNADAADRCDALCRR